MTDAIDRLIAIKERAEFLLAQQDELAKKLVDETDKLDMQLLLANALGALRAASSDVRHDRVRQQVNAARDAIRKALVA